MKRSHVDDPVLGRLVRDYGDHLAEAHACRTASAVFDFSFMSRARLEGAGVLRALATLTPRPLHDLPPGRIRYCMRVDANGHLLADLTVWRHDAETFEVMSGRHDDVALLVERTEPNCRVTDLTTETSVFALQGPDTLAALAAIGDCDAIASLPYFGFISARLAGHRCLVGRLGYTGEPGVEIIVARTDAPALWHALARRARPAGFAAADVVRIEAGFVLFANEFQLPATPVEAGLGRFSAMSGHLPEEPLLLVCLHLEASHAPVLWRTLAPLARPSLPGEVAVTSACHSIVARRPIGLGFARVVDLEQGLPLRDAAGTFGIAARAPLPIYDPAKLRPRRLWLGAHD